MPLSMECPGKECLIKKINGKEEVRRFLESLGFVAGVVIVIVSKISGNLIVQVKDSRIAISKEMAEKIII